MISTSFKSQFSLPCPQACQLPQVHRLVLALQVFLVCQVHQPVPVDPLVPFLQLPCLGDPVVQEALFHPALLSGLVHPEDPVHPKSEYAKEQTKAGHKESKYEGWMFMGCYKLFSTMDSTLRVCMISRYTCK